MNLKKIRTKKEISQTELAYAIKTNPNNISRYENGEREPDIKTIIAIAKALECTIDELLAESEEEIQEANS